ncbi:hypothetical protein [Saccharospirillum alexandrii]|uniref:hypothetical protein n=1 Tax=Saccharospirillum alexandrii TaxID=2448477 RepID=UPI003734EB0E
MKTAFRTFLILAALAGPLSARAGDEALLKVICSPELSLFEVTVTSVDFNYDGIPEGLDPYPFLTDKYGLHQWPKLGESLVCETDENRYRLHRRVSREGDRFALSVNGRSIVEDFVLLDGPATFAKVAKSISVREISRSANIEVCVLDDGSVRPRAHQLVCRELSIPLYEELPEKYPVLAESFLEDK